jgi:hypothetical protein
MEASTLVVETPEDPWLVKLEVSEEIDVPMKNKRKHAERRANVKSSQRHPAYTIEFHGFTEQDGPTII